MSTTWGQTLPSVTYLRSVYVTYLRLDPVDHLRSGSATYQRSGSATYLRSDSVTYLRSGFVTYLRPGSATYLRSGSGWGCLYAALKLAAWPRRTVNRTTHTITVNLSILLELCWSLTGIISLTAVMWHEEQRGVQERINLEKNWNEKAYNELTVETDGRTDKIDCGGHFAQDT